MCRTEVSGMMFLKYFIRQGKADELKGFVVPCADRIGIRSLVELYDWVNERIVLALRNVPLVAGAERNSRELEPCVVRTALSALGHSALKSTDVLKKDVNTLRSWPVIIQAAGKLPFMSDFRHFRREIIGLMAITTRAAMNDDRLHPLLLADLSHRFETLVRNPSGEFLYMSLLCLIGVFKGVKALDKKKTQQSLKETRMKMFKLLFEWMFPEKLTKFQTTLEQAVKNLGVLSALLKLWNCVLAPLAEFGTEMRNHSAMGLRLFKMVAGMLTRVFGVLAQMGEDNTDRSKPLRYALRIYSRIMNAGYIMYGAFDVYKDPVLRDLLGAFVSVLGTVNMGDAFLQVKVSRVMTKVVIALLGKHAMTVLTCSEPLFDRLIMLIVHSSQALDQKTVQLGVVAAVNLGEFLYNNRENRLVTAALARNGAMLTRLVGNNWDYLLNHPQPKYENRVFLRCILEISPGMMQQIYARLRAQIPAQDVADFDAIFKEINAQLAALSISGDVTDFMKSLTKLRLFAQNRNLLCH